MVPRAYLEAPGSVPFSMPRFTVTLNGGTDERAVGTCV